MKVAKNLKRSASMVEDSDVSSTAPAQVTKKSKKNGEVEKDADGNPFWELSKQRRVGVSEFKGKLLINIREYYEKEGKQLPGKKGISLSVEQYTELVKSIKGINAHLKAQGQDIGDADMDVDDAPVVERSDKKAKAKSEKTNIDATSDEDSEEE